MAKLRKLSCEPITSAAGHTGAITTTVSATRPMHKLVLHNHSLLGSQSFAFDAAVKQVLVYG